MDSKTDSTHATTALERPALHGTDSTPSTSRHHQHITSQRMRDAAAHCQWTALGPLLQAGSPVGHLIAAAEIREMIASGKS
jgi:hypothetical protein